jgi:hypothetical protein
MLPVCPHFQVFELTNFYESWYELYATGGHSNFVLLNYL